MHGLAESSAFETFERMEDRVEAKEAEADAQTELAEQMTGDSLRAEFDELDATGGDDDLAALKAKMGVAAPPQADADTAAPAALPPAQAAPVDELEAELAALKSEVAAPADAGSGGDA